MSPIDLLATSRVKMVEMGKHLITDLTSQEGPLLTRRPPLCTPAAHDDDDDDDDDDGQHTPLAHEKERKTRADITNPNGSPSSKNRLSSPSRVEVEQMPRVEDVAHQFQLCFIQIMFYIRFTQY